MEITTKLCRVCDELKPIERFSRKKESKDGLQSRCKDCHAAYSREHWYPANREKQKTAAQTWRDGNKSRIIAQRYGATVSEVEFVQERSFGKCEVCGTDGDLHLDHCHDSGIVRGMLCCGCNTLLGRMGDTAVAVMNTANKFVAYLSMTQQPTP
ncbi:endonuclease domain-containing protein [Mesorhizobium sp.]|uniref:endonuclease domain-containing protein n=1 Tax=Mesorhizobium sp. TaxID=1871066 RepID=UPI00338E7E6E